MVVSREVGGLRDGTPTNKGNTNKQEKPQQTRKPPTNKGNPNKQGEHLSSKGKRLSNKRNTFQARERLSSKGYLPIKCKSLQVVGVSGQGKAVVSDGGYGVIGGRYCLLVWGDAEGTKGKRGRRWRGAGPAGRPPMFPFGGSIVNELLSLGAEPTNVGRQDGLIEWKSDGCIEVGGVHVWAYYYFEDGEDVGRCDWEDHMEIEVEECWI